MALALTSRLIKAPGWREWTKSWGLIVGLSMSGCKMVPHQRHYNEDLNFSPCPVAQAEAKSVEEQKRIIDNLRQEVEDKRKAYG